MSNNFFRNYTIPTITSNVLIKSASNDSPNTSQELLNQIDGSDASACSVDPLTNSERFIESAPISLDNDKQYQHPNRFIAPGRQGNDFTPTKRAPKRRFSGSIGGTDLHKRPLTIGHDESYPEELSSLIKPLFCELCNAQLNSPKTANVHYQSKTHDKSINAWLARNYTEKGVEAPTIKRFYQGSSGPVGPDAYHCECCDLKLTSKLHAEQHYMGRKHKLVLSNISKPSGSGYYNVEGKWVRTGTKATPEGSNDGRFGIGEGFKHESVDGEVNDDITKDLTLDQKDTEAVSIESNVLNETNPKIDPSESLTCKLCNISVTSILQMGIHLEGTKHRKKLKASQDHVADIGVIKTTDTVLASLNDTETSSDMSMYRTPSGSFYCKTCDISMLHQSALVQHLQGKKHIKKSAISSEDQLDAN